MTLMLCLDPHFINTFCENINFNLQTVRCHRGTQWGRDEEVTETVSQMQQPGPGIILEKQCQ